MRRMILLLVGAILLSVSQSSSDAVSDWNKIANDVFLRSGRPGGAVIVDMAYVHIAIYDAVTAIDSRHIPYAVIPSNSVPWASKDAATAAAARRVLLTFYASQQPYIDSVYGAGLALLPNDSTTARGIAIGDTVATRFLALRANDGRNANVPYTFGSGPGVYQLTPGAPLPPTTPQTPWIAHLKPFAMVSDSQFRAPGPPALTSDVYTRDFNEVMRYGAHDSSARTAEQTALGQFYGENPGNQLSRNIRNLVSARGLSIAENARLFVQLYVTIADAVIAGWDSKYHYNFWRPVTAIRAADTDGNPQTLQDTSWLPLLVTPGHPEYPAAHGCVTGGLAYAIERFFNTNHQNVTLSSTSVTGAAITEHNFTNTQDIVSEVINARVYGGMHYRTSAEHGAMIARNVADWVADHFFKPSEAPVPTANLQLWVRADSGLTLNGSTVSRWHDLSGNGNDAIQTDPSRQPQLVAAGLNGKPVLRFDGLNDKLGFTATNHITQFSIFLVINNHQGSSTGNGDGHVITFGAAGDFNHQWFMWMQYPSGPNSIGVGPGYQSGVNAVSPNVAAYDQWRNFSIVTPGSAWSTTLRSNGNDIPVSPFGTDQSISVPLGDTAGSGGGIGGADGVPAGTLVAKCDVAEILIYNAALTDSARKSVESYLATKYGLSQPSIPTAGLQLWLRADAGVDTLNGTVSRWHDQSGNGNDAIQASASRQPLLVADSLNHKPVIRFDGVNDKLGFTGSTHMTQFSLFVVINNRPGSAGNEGHVITLGANGDNAHQWFMWMQYPSGPNSIGLATGYLNDINAVSPNLAAYDQWRNLSIVTTGSVWNTRLRWNGNDMPMSTEGSNQAISVPLGDATGSGGGIGGADGVDAGTLLARCDVAEILVYNVALSDSARKSIESYLATKYGLPQPTASVEREGGSLPEKYVLEQNYPNPFNPSTTIRYGLPKRASVSLIVFNTLGQQVSVLQNGEQDAGYHEARFNASNLASGVYFYRLQAGDFVQSRKLLLLK